ncbi:MAG: molybdopterin biosynthesis protein [Roseiarcus sp.]|jgi:putative molybdopterin biosynthesis protein
MTSLDSDPAARQAADFIRQSARQEQFLSVASRDEAEARFRSHLVLAPLGEETLPLAQCRARVLARDIAAAVDVPGFDRSNVDGFAVRAADLEGARPDAPRRLKLNREVLTPGRTPQETVGPGVATIIATGGMIPRGADAVVMVEQTEFIDAAEPAVDIRQPVASGAAVSAAGSDIGAGETVLRAGAVLGSREIAVLAAIGVADVPVFRRPRVAILSTGNELAPPGAAIRPGQVYDSNGPMLAAAVEELGCVAVPFGIAPDDPICMERVVDEAIAGADVVLLSGGTSKGAGDIAYRTVARFSDPGIVAHGVALKPGKPLCLAVTKGKPVVILPGFPTSATFTFHEFVAPVLRILCGLPALRRETRAATLPVKMVSELGRTEYVLVSLAERPEGGLAAYPISKGSGAVTGFSLADGFFAIPAQSQMAPAGAEVSVTLIGAAAEPVDLMVIGSHCLGLDFLIGKLAREGVTAKVLTVGSTGGLTAAKRGECDIAGIHLMDPATGVYNRAYVDDTLRLVRGYGRLQGVVYRRDDPRFEGLDAAGAIAKASRDPGCLMVNRNAGSGTRLLIDRLIGDARPAGYSHQTRSHNAVAAAIVQRRADWGVAIETVAERYGLGFLPLQAEEYDFAIPVRRFDRPAVRRFVALLKDVAVRAELARMGFKSV